MNESFNLLQSEVYLICIFLLIYRSHFKDDFFLNTGIAFFYSSDFQMFHDM